MGDNEADVTDLTEALLKPFNPWTQVCRMIARLWNLAFPSFALSCAFVPVGPAPVESEARVPDQRAARPHLVHLVGLPSSLTVAHKDAC